MKVEFELDYADLADAMWVSSGAAASGKFFQTVMLYAIVAAAAAAPLLIFVPHPIVAAVEFALVFLLCAWLFRSPSKRNFLRQYRAIFGGDRFRYRVELTEEGVFIDTDTSETKIAWRRVAGLGEHADALYLLFEYQSGLKIPKTAFATPARCGEFTAYATARANFPDNRQNARIDQ